MYYKGEKKVFNIDDALGVTSRGTPWVARRSTTDSGKAWWLPILEKAYAKFNVNYISLRGGIPSMAMRQLTGMPTHSLKTGKYSNEKMISMIREWDRKGYTMTAGCYRPVAGLTSGHAYTLIGVYQLQGETVFKMRNPWSSERYAGPWSDRDKRWTPSLLRSVGHKKGNDGIFFFPAKHFRNPFKSMSVSYYDEGW